MLLLGGALFILSLVASFIAHHFSIASKQSRSTSRANRKPAKVKTKTTPSKTVKNAVNNETVNGTVKWFNKTKGFGFITQSNGDDVFVHQTSITSKPNFLREGQSVTMSVVKDAKGPQAENVKVA